MTPVLLFHWHKPFLISKVKHFSLRCQRRSVYLLLSTLLEASTGFLASHVTVSAGLCALPCSTSPFGVGRTRWLAVWAGTSTGPGQSRSGIMPLLPWVSEDWYKLTRQVLARRCWSLTNLIPVSLGPSRRLPREMGLTNIWRGCFTNSWEVSLSAVLPQHRKCSKAVPCLANTLSVEF